MNRITHLILICYICIIIFLLLDLCDANDSKNFGQTRQRRYLTFINKSKWFFRLNVKVNMVPWNQLFGQTLGFRMNWDEPPNSFHPYHHLHRRTVYSNLEVLIDQNGLNGFHCVRRAICEVRAISQPKEIYHKILKMVFRRKSSATDKWHKSVTPEDCLLSISLCPLSLLDISRYTDL